MKQFPALSINRHLLVMGRLIVTTLLVFFASRMALFGPVKLTTLKVENKVLRRLAKAQFK